MIYAWILIYHLGRRSGFVIDGFANQKLCNAAILQIANRDGSQMDVDDMVCIKVIKQPPPTPTAQRSRG